MFGQRITVASIMVSLPQLYFSVADSSTGENVSKHLSPAGREEMSWSAISIDSGVMELSGTVTNLE